MADRAEELFNEIAQICEQYKTEVPSDRRAWPESIKSRVFELKSMGVSFVKIAERIGIARQTLYAWKRPSSFLPVQVISGCPTLSVGKKIRKQRQMKLTTVTVITPSGYRIEGLDAKSAIEFMTGLESQ